MSEKSITSYEPKAAAFDFANYRMANVYDCAASMAGWGLTDDQSEALKKAVAETVTGQHQQASIWAKTALKLAGIEPKTSASYVGSQVSEVNQPSI